MLQRIVVVAVTDVVVGVVVVVYDAGTVFECKLAIVINAGVASCRAAKAQIVAQLSKTQFACCAKQSMHPADMVGSRMVASVVKQPAGSGSKAQSSPAEEVAMSTWVALSHSSIKSYSSHWA